MSADAETTAADTTRSQDARSIAHTSASSTMDEREASPPIPNTTPGVSNLVKLCTERHPEKP
jgi:hypothetical protein